VTAQNQGLLVTDPCSPCSDDCAGCATSTGADCADDGGGALGTADGEPAVVGTMVLPPGVLATGAPAPPAAVAPPTGAGVVGGDVATA